MICYDIIDICRVDSAFNFAKGSSGWHWRFKKLAKVDTKLKIWWSVLNVYGSRFTLKGIYFDILIGLFLVAKSPVGHVW